jgi:hypothetical protein
VGFAHDIATHWHVSTLKSGEAWKVADLYRAVARGERPAAKEEAVQALVQRARLAWEEQWDLT